jgi:hypothetical protein
MTWYLGRALASLEARWVCVQRAAGRTQQPGYGCVLASRARLHPSMASELTLGQALVELSWHRGFPACATWLFQTQVGVLWETTSTSQPARCNRSPRFTAIPHTDYTRGRQPLLAAGLGSEDGLGKWSPRMLWGVGPRHYCEPSLQA